MVLYVRPFFEHIIRPWYGTTTKTKVPNPNILSPENYDWKKDNDEWLPVMTTTPPAPEANVAV